MANILNINASLEQGSDNNDVTIDIVAGSDQQVVRYDGNTSIGPSPVTINDVGIIKVCEGISLNTSIDTGINENRLMANVNNSLIFRQKEMLRMTDSEFPEDSSLVVFDGIFGDVKKGQRVGEWSDTITFLSNNDGLSGSPTNINVLVSANYFGSHCNIIINRFVGTLSNISTYKSNTPIPSLFRPLGEVIIPFASILSATNIEADILGGCIIGTDGHIEILKDLGRDGGKWGTADQGWSYISGGYFIG